MKTYNEFIKYLKEQSFNENEYYNEVLNYVNEKLLLGKNASKFSKGSSTFSMKIEASFNQLVDLFGEPTKNINTKIDLAWDVYDDKLKLYFGIWSDYNNSDIDWNNLNPNKKILWLVNGDPKKSNKIIDYIENKIK